VSGGQDACRKLRGSGLSKERILFKLPEEVGQVLNKYLNSSKEPTQLDKDETMTWHEINGRLWPG